MAKDLQPNNWKCPDCGLNHNHPHWKDHHQKDPNWKDNVNHLANKGSNPDFQYVCEVCGDPLTAKISNGYNKDIDGLRMCATCQEPREGIPAPLFCPGCGYEQERVVMVFS